MEHDHDDQIIDYRMAEMDLSMARTKNNAKYCNCSSAVFDADNFCCNFREKILKTEAH